MSWPLAISAFGAIVVLGLAVLIFRNVRKRGEAESERDQALEQGAQNDEADEIMAEPIGDAVGWSDRMRDNLPDDS